MMLHGSCDSSIIQEAGIGEYEPSAEPAPAAVVHFFTSIQVRPVTVVVLLPGTKVMSVSLLAILLSDSIYG
jgi:hypothetical protein